MQSMLNISVTYIFCISGIDIGRQVWDNIAMEAYVFLHVHKIINGGNHNENTQTHTAQTMYGDD